MLDNPFPFLVGFRLLVVHRPGVVAGAHFFGLPPFGSLLGSHHEDALLAQRKTSFVLVVVWSHSGLSRVARRVQSKVLR